MSDLGKPSEDIATNYPARRAPVRVLVADDHPIVRTGFRVVLERLPWVDIVGEAGDGRAAVEAVNTLRPDVVFMDISMHGLNGLEATARIIKEFPQTRVIILSRHETEEFYWHALKVGASGYVLKRSAITELESALNCVLGGGIYLSREMSARMVKRLPLQQITFASTPLYELTERQREILQLLAEGQTTKSIARILRVHPKTVDYHRTEMMERLNIHDILGLVHFAVRVGLVEDESCPKLPEAAAAINSSKHVHARKFGRTGKKAIKSGASLNRRFRVALSFPGERREFVGEVATELARAIGYERVFYDGFYEAELARPDLDIYLGDLYREHADLVVPFYCVDYERKKWCQLEWRQMRVVLHNLEGHRLMPFRFDDSPIKGALPLDGYIKIGTRSPQEVTKLILQRIITL
jgi:DNA-binding NarL/FixJ family response regulator